MILLSIGPCQAQMYAKCPRCQGNNTMALTNDGGSLLVCTTCWNQFRNPEFVQKGQSIPVPKLNCLQCGAVGLSLHMDAGRTLTCSNCTNVWITR